MKLKIIIVIVIVVLIVLVLAIYRSPAKAQSAQSDEAIALMNTAVQNMQALGTHVEFGSIGVVKNAAEVIDLLSADTEFFLKYSDGVLRPVTIEELKKRGQSADAYKSALAEAFQKNPSGGDVIYKVAIHGQTTHMTVSPDAKRILGILPMASRLPTVGYYRGTQTTDRLRECTKRILSYDIFGREAESLTACTQAFCSAGLPSNCELSEISSRHGWFGSVVYDPNSLPVAGNVVHRYCRGTAKYKWVVSLGHVNISDYITLDIANAQLGGQGNIVSEVYCGP